MPGRQESFRRAQKINQRVFGREATVLIGVVPHLEVQGPGSIRHQYAWVPLLRMLYLFLSVVYRIPENKSLLGRRAPILPRYHYHDYHHYYRRPFRRRRHRRGSGGHEKSGKEEKIRKDETAERDTAAKRDRCPDVTAEHPDFVFRPGRTERLEAIWHSLARVLGVLELLGTSLRVLLYPVSGEASGRPLALHSDFGCSRTHTEVARSYGNTGPGDLLHTAPLFSFALLRRSFPLFAGRSHMGRSGTLPHAAPALYFALPRRYSITSLVRFFTLQRCYSSC